MRGLIVAMALLSSLGCKTSRPAQAHVPKIGVATYGAHPILDVMNDGFKQRLTELGYKDGVNCQLIWKSVEGDMNLSSQIAQALVAAGSDVIVSLTTPISQAVAKQALHRVPIVFSGLPTP
jgi:putative ABC transport system substrate-binding protein